MGKVQLPTRNDLRRALSRCIVLSRIIILDYTGDGGGDIWSSANLHNLEGFKYWVKEDKNMLRHFTPVIKRPTCKLQNLLLTCENCIKPYYPKNDLVAFIIALKTNTSLYSLELFNGFLFSVPELIFEECFQQNRTIQHTLPYVHYGLLNKVCKELKASPEMRAGVPRQLDKEEDIREFLQKLQKNQSKWQKLQKALLHREVGKFSSQQST